MPRIAACILALTAGARGVAELKTIVFVKYHQIGGTAAKQFLQDVLHTTSHLQFFADHDDSLSTAWKYSANGVPNSTLLTMLLRHPVDKFLSAFFKHEFPSVLAHGALARRGEKYDHFEPESRLDRFLGQSRSLAMMRNISAVAAAIDALLEISRAAPPGCSSNLLAPNVTGDGLVAGGLPRCAVGCDHFPAYGGTVSDRLWEYTTVARGSADAAIKLLRHAAVVGLQERFADWQRDLCEALDKRATPACAKPREVNSRHSIGHPQVSDLPPEFIAKLERLLHCEMLVYEEAKLLAARGPRQRLVNGSWLVLSELQRGPRQSLPNSHDA